MKLIDEKGRVFGRINIFDLIILLAVISLVPFFYFGAKMLVPKQKAVLEVQEEMVASSLEIYCKFFGVDKGVAEQMSEGDKEIDENGKTEGEIVEIVYRRPHRLHLNIEQRDKAIKVNIPENVDILTKLNLEIQVDKKGNVYYKGQNVKISKDIVFNTEEYRVEGTVVPEPREHIQVEVLCLFENVNKNVVSIIEAGDTEINNEGEVIGKMTEVIQVSPKEPDRWLFFRIRGEERENDEETNDGNNVEMQAMDILAKMQLGVLMQGGEFYYKKNKLGVGNSIEFQTDKYVLYGKIIPQLALGGEGPYQFQSRIELELYCLFRELPKDIFDLIKVGDKEVNSKGEVEAQLIEIFRGKERFPISKIFEDSKNLREKKEGEL